jgi:hypothetical protein
MRKRGCPGLSQVCLRVVGRALAITDARIPRRDIGVRFAAKARACGLALALGEMNALLTSMLEPCDIPILGWRRWRLTTPSRMSRIRPANSTDGDDAMKVRAKPELPGDVLVALRESEGFRSHREFAGTLPLSHHTLWRLEKVTWGSDPATWDRTVGQADIEVLCRRIGSRRTMIGGSAFARPLRGSTS